MRHALRSIGRFVGAVLATSGALLLVDAGLTLAWQEPVSAVLAGRQQATLRSDLRADLPQVRRDLRDLAGVRAPGARLSRLAARAASRASAGQAVGRIVLPTLDRRYVVVEGSDEASLRKGPGRYPSTGFPGQGRTVAFAGHRTTYGAPFRTIDDLRPGDPVVLDMPYGRFRYDVEETRIVPPSATWVIGDVPGPERVVLTACHPLYSAAQRIVVFARLTRASLP